MFKLRNVLALSLSLFLTLPSLAADTANEPKKVTTEEKYAGIELSVNINIAAADEIAAMLTGVGEKKAADIVKYRESNGPFNSADDLLQVKGIGLATIDKNRERIKF